MIEITHVASSTRKRGAGVAGVAVACSMLPPMGMPACLWCRVDGWVDMGSGKAGAARMVQKCHTLPRSGSEGEWRFSVTCPV